jgi:hypothetical protein
MVTLQGTARHGTPQLRMVALQQGSTTFRTTASDVRITTGIDTRTHLPSVLQKHNTALRHRIGRLLEE